MAAKYGPNVLISMLNRTNYVVLVSVMFQGSVDRGEDSHTTATLSIRLRAQPCQSSINETSNLCVAAN
jgi:hypothetical protein